MRFGVCLAVIAVLCGATPVLAQDEGSQNIERASTPSWVQTLSADREEAPVDNAAVRILLLDEQVRIDETGVHTHIVRRTRIQTSQGLGMVSTVSGSWSPPRQRLEVHAVRIIRGDQVIDVLANQSFQTLRREDNLESSMLDGVLTATLQPRDLRVGDILETSFTIHDDGGVLAPHRELLKSLSSGLTIDHYRMRASWPAGSKMRVEGPAAWDAAAVRRQGGFDVYEFERRAVLPAQMPDDLPTRFYLDRLFQITDFEDWADISRLMAPLYARAETLEADSPLNAEIERIRAAHSTDAARASAALRLVQDQIRYLALSMGEGGYVPASADEVWRTRYGDCKGKTVLLLALLHGLGIDAEAVLVSTRLGDGLDTRLPMVSWFDHVIVRAEVDGRQHWLDGARVGDHDLSAVVPPGYSWDLPVRAEGAGLEAIPRPALTQPTTVVLVTADVSAGLDAEAKVELDYALSGDAGTSMRRSVASIAPEQLQAMLRSSWSEEEDKNLKVDSVDTRYDEDTNTFHILMSGRTRMPWISSSGGRFTGMDETALALPTQAERVQLHEAWKEAPYSVGHPASSRVHSRLILPDGGRGFRIEGDAQTIEGAGYRVERSATLENGVVDVIVTTTSLASEVTAAEMKAARDRNKDRPVSAIRVRAPAGYQATAADRARLEAGDSDTEDLIKRAEALSEIGDYDGAVVLLDGAIEKDAENVDALKARGAARIEADDLDGGRADYDSAVDLDPADVDALLGQGYAAIRQGKASEAVVSYSVALRLEPGNVGALSGRASAYYQIRRWDRALADFRALKATDPENLFGPYGELRVLSRTGREAEALELIGTILEEEPADTVALDARLRLARQSQAPLEALPQLDTAIAASPENASLLMLRAQAKALGGRADEARVDFAAAREIGGTGDPMELNNICWNRAIVGFDLEAALADCDAALAAAPEAGFIDSRAMVLLQMERYAEAEADYDKALAETPDLAPSLFGRGVARIALGNVEAGRADIARALSHDIDVSDDFLSFLASHGDIALQVPETAAGR